MVKTHFRASYRVFGLFIPQLVEQRGFSNALNSNEHQLHPVKRDRPGNREPYVNQQYHQSNLPILLKSMTTLNPFNIACQSVTNIIATTFSITKAIHRAVNLF